MANTLLLEDLDSGDYVMAFTQSFETEAKREPGLDIAGYTFVGRVLLIKGNEVRHDNRILDIHRDLVMDDHLAALLDVRRLTVREARIGRRTAHENAVAFRAANQDAVMVCRANSAMVPLPTAGATCSHAGCKKVQLDELRNTTCKEHNSTHQSSIIAGRCHAQVSKVQRIILL